MSKGKPDQGVKYSHNENFKSKTMKEEKQKNKKQNKNSQGSGFVTKLQQ